VIVLGCWVAENTTIRRAGDEAAAQEHVVHGVVTRDAVLAARVSAKVFVWTSHSPCIRNEPGG
jgi:hypothetical protein